MADSDVMDFKQAQIGFRVVLTILEKCRCNPSQVEVLVGVQYESINADSV